MHRMCQVIFCTLQLCTRYLQLFYIIFRENYANDLTFFDGNGYSNITKGTNAGLPGISLSFDITTFDENALLFLAPVVRCNYVVTNFTQSQFFHAYRAKSLFYLNFNIHKPGSIRVNPFNNQNLEY